MPRRKAKPQRLEVVDLNIIEPPLDEALYQVARINRAAGQLERIEAAAELAKMIRMECSTIQSQLTVCLWRLVAGDRKAASHRPDHLDRLIAKIRAEREFNDES